MRGTPILVGALALLAGGVAGCAHANSAATRPTASTPASGPPAIRTIDAGHIAVGPAKPEPDVWYAFDLYVHCGGEYTLFGGSAWHTTAPPGDVTPSPDSNGQVEYTGYLPGWIELTTKDSAIFRAGNITVEYARAGSAPVCS